jgi:site-specific DNA-adenine methylase
MRSPLRDPNKFKSAHVVREMTPSSAVICSYLFFDGAIELSLIDSERFVVAHTNNYTVSEFWACARFDPHRLSQLIKHINSNTEEKLIYAMQENWAKYKDPFVRSAIFYLLNRYSGTSQISAGPIEFEKVNPVSLNHIKSLKKIKNFHLNRTKSEDFLLDIEQSSSEINNDMILIPVGNFNYNLFDKGKSTSHEATAINHGDLADVFRSLKKKSVMIYKNHRELYDLYKTNNLTMVDTRGNKTTDHERCEDLIIANF